KIHAVWSHVHPSCTNTSLYKCQGDKKDKIFSVNVSTTYKTGPELKHIDNILSKEGIDLPAGDNYELSAVYENPERNTIDSMVALGVFCASKKFVRPDWASETSSAPAGSDSILRGTTAEKSDEVKKATKGIKKPANASCNDLYCGIKPAKQKD
ncbi:MAG: hypothetical protein K2Z81_04210, partial [Cyanobacteria bacterium]|nr:hypothetical protein [Cyanobacteriota bacterium]